MGILDLIFPKFCVNCKKIGGYLCKNCEVGLWEEQQICPICARLSRYGLPHEYCHKSYALDGLTGLWAYEGAARKIITRAKYHFYFDLLNELFLRAGDILDRPEYTYFQRFLAEKPLIVPVPLHPKRLKERGFNQAEVIAKLVARYWKQDTRNLLVKTRDTGHQVGRTREDRIENINGAFELNRASRFMNHASILLVDDVWTTGATLSECAKTLKKAGVKKVWGLVLAR